MWAIVTTSCAVVAIILVRGKPNTPPSKTATLKRGPLCRNLGTLFKNRNFVTMLVGYTLVYGVYTVFGASVSFFTDEYGFTTVSNSLTLLDSNWEFGGLLYHVWTWRDYLLLLADH